MEALCLLVNNSSVLSTPSSQQRVSERRWESQMRKGPLLTCRTSHTITFSFKPQRWVTYICSTGKHNVWRGTVKWGHKYAEPRINTFSPWLLGYRIEAAQIKQTLTRPLLNERGIELHIQRLPQPLIELMTCSNTLLSASSYSKNRSCKKKKK